MAGAPCVAVGPRRLFLQVERHALVAPLLQVVGREYGVVPSAPAVKAVGGRVYVVFPRLVRIEYLGVGVESREYGVLRRLGHALGASPALEQPAQLGGRYRHHGTVARVEIHAHLVVDDAERAQVTAFGELVAAAHVYVVHEYVAVLADEFECAGALDGIGGLLLVVGLLLPLARGERRGGGRLYAVAVSLGLVEEVVDAVAQHDVAVDARETVLGNEQRLRLTLEVGERLVGIGIIDHVGTVAILHRPVNHVFPRFGVVDRLRGPYALEFLLSLVAFLHVDNRMCPVDQVGRPHQHHGAVGVPAVVRYHVGGYHVERAAVLAAQDVGVAHAARGAYLLGVEHGTVAVQGAEVESVIADGIAYCFLRYVVTREVHEKVAGIVLFRDGVGLWRCCHGGRCHAEQGKESKQMSFHTILVIYPRIRHAAALK